MTAYDDWYICIDDHITELELYHRSNEQLPEIAGMIELFFNYRAVSGTLFVYPQEFPGYRCITVRDFMAQHEHKAMSWVITRFNQDAKHAAA